MKEIGQLLIGLGILLIGGAFFIDVTVAVPYVTGGYDLGLPREVANIYALHVQSLVFQGGFAAFVAGAIFYARGDLGSVEREKRPGRRGSYSVGGGAS